MVTISNICAFVPPVKRPRAGLSGRTKGSAIRAPLPAVWPAYRPAPMPTATAQGGLKAVKRHDILCPRLGWRRAKVKSAITALRPQLCTHKEFLGIGSGKHLWGLSDGDDGGCPHRIVVHRVPQVTEPTPPRSRRQKPAGCRHQQGAGVKRNSAPSLRASCSMLCKTTPVCTRFPGLRPVFVEPFDIETAPCKGTPWPYSCRWPRHAA